MRVFISLLAVLLTNCGPECTLRGCVDTVSFVFTPALETELVDGTIARVCVGETCLDHKVSAYNPDTHRLDVFQGEPAGLRADVTLTLTRDGVERLTRTWPQVSFKAFEVNGEGCGPVCHAAGPLTVE